LARVAVFTIATNKYFNYWEVMIKSADKYLFMSDEITFHVFTNIDFDESIFSRQLDRIKIIVHKVPNLVWPNATLYRYKYILNYGEKMDYDYFVHIDADMQVVPHGNSSVEEILNGKSIALVMHPGYWRVDFPQKLFFYLKNFKFILKDIFLFINYGNLGTWSKNRRSGAFVSRCNRRRYYCGAVWFGKKNDILNLATELDTYTDFDLKNKNIPEWNDESYLNYWASKNDFVSLTPSFCYEESYKNLEYLNPFIIAVDKEKYENISK